jgi:hypothetical protein
MLPNFLVQQFVTGLSITYIVSALEAAISLQSSDYFHWGMTVEIILV